MPPFRHLMPVRFADVDHARIVYYPVFFHYFHITFEEFFRARLGWKSYLALLDEDRIGFPAVRSECDYKAPLAFGDLMEVEMSLERLSERSITLGFHVYRLDEPPAPDGAGEPAGSPADGRVLAAQGRTVAAVVDLEAFRATALPDRLRALFEALG